jgi:hypothetical protein
MTKAIQVKLLIAILAVLVVIASLMKRGGNPIQVTPADRQLQRKLAQKLQPSPKRYLIP